MTFWRTISSLAGGKAGKRTCADCPDGLPGEDPQFSAAVTALGAKLAKADGSAEHGEYAAFSEVFQPDAAAARDVRRLYDLARQTTRGYESYARQIARRYRRCEGVLEDVLDGLFHIAKADGAVSSEELAFIERVAELFGLSPLTLRRIKTDHLGAPADDPYVVLGVAPDASDEQVRRAWRGLLSAAHPDRALGSGRPEAEVAAAHRRSAQLNAAYAKVMRERHELVGAEGA
jgi:DnaJ like chaperone protein